MKTYRPLFLLAAGLLLAAVGCDSIDTGPFDATDDASPIANVNTTAKAYNLPALAAYNPASYVDAGGESWTLLFVSNNNVSGNTRFSYVLTKPDVGSCDLCDSPPTGEIVFSYVIPECASYIASSASPTPTSVSGDTLKWDTALWSVGANPLSLDFAIPAGESFERIGIVATGLSDPGFSAPSIDYALGPCNAVYDLDGTVFLNDTSDEDVPANDDQDVGEPGIANVEVAVQEYIGGAWAFDDSPRQLTDADGNYHFSVLGPPVPGLPTKYRVVITKVSTLGGAINESLFSGIFKTACDDDCPDESESSQISKEADLDDIMEIDFGFEVDLEGAIAKFNAGDLYADGLPRKYWYRQNRQNGNGNFPLDYTKAEFLDLLNCSDGSFDPPGPIDCILDPTGVGNDFSGADDSMMEQILPIDGVNDLKDTKALLEKVPGSKLSKNDPNGNFDKYLTLQKELQQQILIALLNYTVGRGLCSGDLGGDGRCLAFDEPGMRIIIRNAIIVLIQSDFSVLGKASSGKVGSNSELLSNTY